MRERPAEAAAGRHSEGQAVGTVIDRGIVAVTFEGSLVPMATLLLFAPGRPVLVFPMSYVPVQMLVIWLAVNQRKTDAGAPAVT